MAGTIAFYALALAGGMLAQTINSQAQADEAIDSAIKISADYSYCVQVNAERLGKDTSDPAHDVVVAAEQSCDFKPTRDKLFAALASGYEMTRVNHLLTMIPQIAETNAMTKLIELRARRGSAK